MIKTSIYGIVIGICINKCGHMADEDLKDADGDNGEAEQIYLTGKTPEIREDIPEITDTVLKKIARFSNDHDRVLAEKQSYGRVPSFVDVIVLELRKIPKDGPLADLFAGKKEDLQERLKKSWLDKTIQPSRNPFDINLEGEPICPKSFENNPRVKLIEEAMKKPELIEWFRRQPLLKDAFDERYLNEMMFRRFKTVTDSARMAAILIAYKIFTTPDFIERIPSNILVSISSAYTDYLQQRRKEFVKRCPELIESTRKKLYEAIDRGEIPITKKKVEMVLDRLHMTLADTMVMRLNDTYGSYDKDTLSIYLDANLDDSELEETFHHEILHALSGMTILSSDEWTNESLRVGLAYRDDSLFRWLNEAVTETLNIKVFGHEDGDFYKESRKLLDLLSKDIDFKLFVDAYFEEYDPDAPKEERLAAWKKLKAAIDAKFGSSPNFLVKLNNFIENYSDVESGAASASKKYTELGGGFSEFLRAA